MSASPLPSSSNPLRKLHAFLLNSLCDRPLPGLERCVLAIALAAGIALRVIAILRMRVDSDEPQHLHVAWGWAQGLLQYRDVFDNHTPLFHLAMAPFVRLFGETPDIMFLMRGVMVPLFIGMLAAIYGIMRSLVHHRAALWTVVFAAFFPRFFMTSAEFRTDDQWVMFQLISVWVLVSGPLNIRRAFLGGLMLGLSLGSSLKTSVFALSSLLALVSLPLISPDFRRSFDWKKAGSAALALAVGFCIVPGVLAVLFKTLHIWDNAYYCIVQHSIVPPSAKTKAAPFHIAIDAKKILVPILFLFLCWAARLIARNPVRPQSGNRAAWLILTCGVYYLIMKLLYPVVQFQTRLSYYPLCTIAAVLFLFAIRRNEDERREGNWAILPAIALLEIAALIMTLAPWHHGTREMRLFLEETLKITKPTDLVMDLKGETVFRKRPWHFILERFTEDRIRRGLLKSDIVQSCIDKRAHAVINESIMVILEDDMDFLPKDRQALNRIYIPVGRLSVAGKYILKDAHNTAEPIQFNIELPARYSMITPKGKAAGLLDGKPCADSTDMQAGPHSYSPAPGETSVALVWSQAVENGFSPFALTNKESDFKKKTKYVKNERNTAQ